MVAEELHFKVLQNNDFRPRLSLSYITLYPFNDRVYNAQDYYDDDVINIRYGNLLKCCQLVTPKSGLGILI